MSKFFNYINEIVKNNPWRMIFVSAISSGLTVLFLLPNIPAQLYSLLLFPLSAGSFAAITTWIINKYKERPQLHFFVPDDDSFFFPCVEKNIYPAPYRLVVYLRISNHSPLPVSLLQFDLDIPNYRILHSPMHVEPLDEYTTFSIQVSQLEERGNKIPIKKFLIKPILTLSPYQATEGYLFFPMCPEISENEVKANLKITTTRGLYNLHIPIKRACFYEQKL